MPTTVWVCSGRAAIHCGRTCHAAPRDGFQDYYAVKSHLAPARGGVRGRVRGDVARRRGSAREGPAPPSSRDVLPASGRSTRSGRSARRNEGTEVFRTRLHTSRQQCPSLFDARPSSMPVPLRWMKRRASQPQNQSPCPRASSRSELTGWRPCNPPAPPQNEISLRNNLA